MKLAQRDSLDVDRRIPVTEIRHQLLFKTQNNFFRENLTMDNSLREKRHQQDGSSCKKWEGKINCSTKHYFTADDVFPSPVSSGPHSTKANLQRSKNR